jgi:hypothetical protein
MDIDPFALHCNISYNNGVCPFMIYSKDFHICQKCVYIKEHRDNPTCKIWI